MHDFYYIKTYEHKHKISSERADNIRPYIVVLINAVLRSGTISFAFNKILFPTEIFNFPFSTFNFIIFYNINYFEKFKTYSSSGYFSPQLLRMSVIIFITSFV